MWRISVVLSFVAVLWASGCSKPTLPPEEIAKLEGGKTTVVVYGFCLPVDRLIKTSITRHELQFFVNGKSVGRIKSCSYGTFTVPSGYWSGRFVPTGLLGYPSSLQQSIFRPGTTQYLYMAPAGYNSFSGYWVSKEKAEAGIAEIKQISQVF